MLRFVGAFATFATNAKAVASKTVSHTVQGSHLRMKPRTPVAGPS
jgi:hypothetical protein